MPCPFASALGVPGKGFHEKRIGGFAFNDTMATLVAAVLTSFFFKINIITSIVGWFVLGEVLHYIFGVNTAFLKKINMSPKCD
jgi:hexokinase